MTWLLALSCAVSVAADLMLVCWAKRADHPLPVLLGAIAAVCVASVLWAMSMYRGVEASTAISVYAVGTVLCCAAIGALAFGEPITARTAAGIALGMASMVLVGARP